MKYNKKLIIGIPTRNEASNIANLTQHIALAIAELGLNVENITIVNADSASVDGTCQLFLDQKTIVKKLVIKNAKPGKGRNIRSLLQYAFVEQSELILIDGDIRSFDTSWIRSMLAGLIDGHDFIVPSYARYQLEGNTTNHYAYPLLYAMFGDKTPRQPIAGDFAISQKFIRHLCSLEWPDYALNYGVDIYLTLQALICDYSIHEVELGNKIHNPSFFKMEDMFREVCYSAFATLAHCENLNLIKERSTTDLIKKQMLLPSSSQIELSIRNAMSERNLKLVKDRRPEWVEGYIRTQRLDAQGWAAILSLAVRELDTNNAGKLTEDIAPCFIIRTMSYLESIADDPLFEPESELVEQAMLVRRAITAGSLNI